jgi:hypothetical protein
MKVYLVVGIICLLSAVLLSCIAGVYAATNSRGALVIGLTAGVALLVGVKWVADRS